LFFNLFILIFSHFSLSLSLSHLAHAPSLDLFSSPTPISPLSLLLTTIELIKNLREELTLASIGIEELEPVG
jgi:hypothetical protein